MAGDEDIVDVDEVFCGWKTNHRFHFAADLASKSPLFVCPGYEGEVE